jgi:hypothetical protein
MWEELERLNEVEHSKDPGGRNLNTEKYKVN